VLAQQIGGTGSDIGSVAAVDNSGNTIVAGTFQGTVNFGGGPLSSTGSSSIFIAKYSTAGAHLWSKSIWGTGNNDAPLAIAFDSTDNIIMTGKFSDSINFGGGIFSTSGSLYDYADLFLVKFSSNGSHMWSKSFGAADGEDIGYGVAVDSSNNVILTGVFQGFVDFGDGWLQSYSKDMFVAKYSSTGAHIWSNNFLSMGDDFGYGVSVDSNDNVIVTGSFWNSIDFGAGWIYSTGFRDIYVAKFSPAGAFQWSENFGVANTLDNAGYAVGVDSSNNVIIAGVSNGAVDFGGGQLGAGVQMIFISKFSSSGAYVWSKGLGSNAPVKNIGSMSVDAAGSVIVTGHFMGTINSLTSAGGYDIFVAKYSSSGTNTWSKSFGNTGYDVGNSVAVDSASNAVVTGYFEQTVDFGGSILNSAGGQDIFLIKLAP
jgi:hypothetical protein